MKLLPSLLICALILSGCGHVKIVDKEICADAGENGAACAHTLTNEKRWIEKTRWDIMRYGWGCMSPDALAEMIREIKQACESLGKCDYEGLKKSQNRLFGAFEKARKSPRRRK